METKTCSRCGEEKPIGDYYVDKRADRPYAHCKKCHTQIDREYKARGGPKPKEDYAARTEKVCTRCKELKPLSEFHKQADKPDGYKYHCKACDWAFLKEKRANDPRYIETYQKAREKNRDHARERAKEHYQENIEQERAKDRAFYEREAERLRARRKEKYQADSSPEQRAELAKRMREYRKRNPERVRVYSSRKRAKRRKSLLASVAHYTVQEFAALCTTARNRCLACGKRRVLTADHVLPLVSGGSNGIENIQPLCRSCNSSKKAKHIDYRIGCEYRGIELSSRLPRRE